ncbi:Dicer-like protein 1 [Grifola frondosa]|uniref:Dicer-like protein 1 n=1 Tax=Grifola frondosa TaxID=5627 RepID=A0A1C7ME54_GRIFR|nr:Dicer-like protein 1 [Grifola frondosa]
MTVDMDVLIPRRYQEEIFVRAQQGNVIAALDTGSGKTYISTLLIKWVAARDIGLGRIIVFLVPKVALVQQQGDFIAQQTPLRVSQFCGATAMDMSDRAGWKKQLSGSDVFVMTAQIFLNILTHSHWSLENISLMRPKVFGMTASPIWNPKDATESLATLERNLDAKVIAVRDHVDELMGHSPKPEEVIHEYPLPPDLYPEYPGHSLWQRLSLGFLPAEIDIPVERIMTRYQVANHSLGPYAADLYLYLDIKQRVEQLVHNAHEADMSFLALTQFVTKDGDHGSNIENSTLHPRVKQLQNVLKECSHLFEDESNPDMVPVEVPLKWCSPKLRMLADILFAHYTATFQGIVFVEQRHVAACLARILPCIPQLNHLIRCGQLIGHGASHTASAHLKGMALKTQQDSVNFFRKRQVNLLIATSVAEEGLDFPSVDKDRYRAFSESEPQLRMVYQMREDAAKKAEEAEEAEDHDDPADILERERFVVPSTGAVLTYNSSISLLGHLCSLIPRDRFTPVQLPKYSGNNVATVRLPSSLPYLPIF